MELNDHLYNLLQEKANKISVDQVSLGLGYTAVTTSAAGIGIAYTYFDRKTACSLVRKYHDYENRPAVELLEKIKSGDALERSMALALVNALQYQEALLFPEDHKNETLFKEFNLKGGLNIAMVGYFRPIVRSLEAHKAPLEVLDDFHGIGNKERFYQRLRHWADVLLLTSTSILNCTTEEILENVGQKVKTVMLGPSTPMVPDAFKHLPVHMLAGTVPTNTEMVLKAVRHGLGTPFIHRYSKKAFCRISPELT